MSQRDPFARINSAKLDLFRRCTARVGIIKLRHYSVSNAFSLSPAGRERKEGALSASARFYPARLIPRVYPTPTLDYNFLLHFHFISRPAEQGVETLASDRATGVRLKRMRFKCDYCAKSRTNSRESGRSVIYVCDAPHITAEMLRQ